MVSLLRIRFVIFGLSGTCLNIFLMKAKDEALKNMWGLPEGTLNEDESLEIAAQRAYCELAGFENIFLEQLYTFVFPSGSLEKQTVQILYYAMTNRNKCSIEPNLGTDGNKWFPVSNLPSLNLFDRKYCQLGLKKLQEKTQRQPIGFYQLPVEFELSDLRRIYEMILGRNLNLNDFKSKMFEIDLLVPLSEKGTFRFNTKKYFELKHKGFYLDI